VGNRKRTNAGRRRPVPTDKAIITIIAGCETKAEARTLKGHYEGIYTKHTTLAQSGSPLMRELFSVKGPVRPIPCRTSSKGEYMSLQQVSYLHTICMNPTRRSYVFICTVIDCLLQFFLDDFNNEDTAGCEPSIASD